MTDTLPENVADNAVAPEDSGSDKMRPFSVGTTLREARDRLGLSVADVSASIKLAPRQIEALEADDFAHLPEPAFIRGFVRSYAKLLSLEPAKLLAALPQAEKQSVPLQAKALNEVPFPNAYSERKPNIIWLMAALIVAVVLASSAWLMSGSSKKSAEQKKAGVQAMADNVVVVQSMVMPVPVAVSAIEASSVSATSTSISQGISAPSQTRSPPGIIRLLFDKDSWVEVTDRNGKILLSQINPQGTEQNLDGAPPFSLVIGEAKNVHLYYKGKLVDLTPYSNLDVARLTLE
ncbi:MAG: RodZ domain-containing protein [Gallionellaceae bacterium]